MLHFYDHGHLSEIKISIHDFKEKNIQIQFLFNIKK